MPRFVSLHRFMPYGAPDLLAAQPTHLARALTAASAFAVAAFAIALLVPRPHPRSVVVDAVPWATLEPPPTVQTHDFVVKSPAPAASPKTGLVVPVEAAPPAIDFEPPTGGIGLGVGPATGGPAVPPTPVDGAQIVAPVASPDTPVAYFDVLPEPLTRVEPEYPPLAREARIDGRVLVRMLVSRTGAVLQVEADPKNTVPILEPAALEAARHWLFKPALANGHPVAVWVAVPFVFKLPY